MSRCEKCDAEMHPMDASEYFWCWQCLRANDQGRARYMTAAVSLPHTEHCGRPARELKMLDGDPTPPLDE